MKRSNALLWTVLILFAAFVFWMITSGQLDVLADKVVEGYWKFIEDIVNIRRR